ncbi:protein of unknown function [Vibrio tapetis subsp. tapetis]|uniref:Uncharacterized protein n=2 Tax=Vibrio tapetis TaxID=52443 RepID=A0A2N8ZDB5_9VIBR|nr:protein of unknown function [Vibrio tapetis subsp. tapetis]
MLRVKTLKSRLISFIRVCMWKCVFFVTAAISIFICSKLFYLELMTLEYRSEYSNLVLAESDGNVSINEYPSPVISLQQLIAVNAEEETNQLNIGLGVMKPENESPEVNLTELRTRLNTLVAINENK